jgi:VWFA-related protein
MLLGFPLLVSAQQSSLNGDRAVSLLFTAIDKNKHFVTTLRKEDIRVIEDGVQQEIAAFGQQTDKPLSIVIMLDMSVSQERVIPIAKFVSREFVDSIVRPGKDSVGVITFTREAKFEQELTTDLEQVRRAIERVEFKPPPGYARGGLIITDLSKLPGMIVTNPSKLPKPTADQLIPGSTAIWDAISFASEKSGAQVSDKPRRIIILITDGEDTSSKRKLNEAVESAIKSGVAVYSMGIGDEYYGGTNKDALQKISDRTGGRAFFPKIVQDVRDAFVGIEQELRAQYLFSYSPVSRKSDNKLHKLKIEIINPELRRQGLLLSYPQGYLARTN